MHRLIVIVTGVALSAKYGAGQSTIVLSAGADRKIVEWVTVRVIVRVRVRMRMGVSAPFLGRNPDPSPIPNPTQVGPTAEERGAHS